MEIVPTMTVSTYRRGNRRWKPLPSRRNPPTLSGSFRRSRLDHLERPQRSSGRSLSTRSTRSTMPGRPTRSGRPAMPGRSTRSTMPGMTGRAGRRLPARGIRRRLRMAALEGVGRLPFLEVLLATPARVDEVGVGALHRPQQLEPLETVRSLHHAGTAGEPLFQRGPHLGRNGQCIDLHNAHEVTLVRDAGRATAHRPTRIGTCAHCGHDITIRSQLDTQRTLACIHHGLCKTISCYLISESKKRGCSGD